MRVLIGYDGSASADAILEDLEWAGLPRECEVKLVNVADVWVDPAVHAESAAPAAASGTVAVMLKRAETEAGDRIEQAAAEAKRAADLVAARFPDWEVVSEALNGAPAWELIDEAERWQADLIMVGSQNRSMLGKLFLGSVSKTVVNESKRSVRVARRIERKNPDAPPQIIIGIDGSDAAREAVIAVGRRVWPHASQVRLVTAYEPASAAALAGVLPQAAAMIAGAKSEAAERQDEMMRWAVRELQAVGLDASISIRRGDARRVLLREARDFKADSIFVGTRDFKNSLERFRLGSVSAGVLASAHCSVEVVRAPHGDEAP